MSLDSVKECRFITFSVQQHYMSGTMRKNVSVSGDVRRRPNGNGRPSAFRYKSFHFFSPS